jgi:fatty-acid desaturase
VILFVVVGSSALFIGVKLFERRLGKALVRAGIAFLLVVPLLGVTYAAWGLSRHWVAPIDLVLLATFAIVTGLGTSFGYHRLLTHRSFGPTHRSRPPR